MHFQLKYLRDAHSDFGTCVQWTNESQVLTCGDDHKLNLWNSVNFVQVKTIKLPDDYFVTDIALFSGNPPTSVSQSSSKRELGVQSSAGQQNQLKVILACSDGKIHFINVSLEKIEKSIDAHLGAIICLKLSLNESAILTSGEDGQLKIWSKTGMLRNTIATESSPIHCALWSSDQFERILYSTNDQLKIRLLTPNSKTISWVGHKGYVIRCVDWNLKFKLILSSDEMGAIRIWDREGNHLKNVEIKATHLIPTCLAWSQDGERFACGGHNFVLLAGRNGHVLSVQHLNERKKVSRVHDEQTKQNNNVSLNELLASQLSTAQSLMRISWSNNSIVSISNAGQLLSGFIVNESVQWLSYTLVVLDCRKVLLKNILVDYEQELEFSDPIVSYSIKHSHLIILCSNQCYVYPLLSVDPLNCKLFNTINSTIIQLKDANFYMIVQSSTQFALVGQSSSIMLFNYQGRQIFVFKLGYGNRLEEELNSSMISLSEDTLAFRDPLDNKVIRFFDSANGMELLRNKEAPHTNDRRSSATKIDFKHEQEILSLKLNTNKCPSNERKCAFIDRNLDLYLTLVRPTSTRHFATIKLINMCTSFQWNEQFDLLAAIEHNSKLNIFIYPQSAFLDNDLLRMTTIVKEYDSLANSQSDHRRLSVIAFQRDQIKLADEHGSSNTNVINPFYILLHSYANKGRFDYALKLCRLNPTVMNNTDEKRSSFNDLSLWATFTAMALNKCNLDLAEIGYAAVEIFERVMYIKEIKQINDKMHNKLDAKEPVNSSKLIAAEAMKKGEIALLCGGNYLEAEIIFLHGGFVVRCLFMHLTLFHWSHAIQIANKYDRLCTDELNKFLIKINKKNLIDDDDENMLSRIVLTYRMNYLERYEIEETDTIFRNMYDQFRPLDWECVDRIQKEQYFLRFNIKRM